jgi:hypothetical protein
MLPFGRSRQRRLGRLAGKDSAHRMQQAMAELSSTMPEAAIAMTAILVPRI